MFWSQQSLCFVIEAVRTPNLDKHTDSRTIVVKFAPRADSLEVYGEGPGPD